LKGHSNSSEEELAKMQSSDKHLTNVLHVCSPILQQEEMESSHIYLPHALERSDYQQASPRSAGTELALPPSDILSESFQHK
jgi:hypothetical protein